MNNQAYFQINFIIEEIELTEKLLSKLMKLDEPLDESLLKEMERKKRNLIKEMLKQMIDASLSFRQFESLYQKIFSYLKSGEKEYSLPNDFQKNMNRIERFLGV